MSTLREAFISAAGGEEDAVLTSPGSAGLFVILQSINMPVSVEDIDSIYKEESWPEDYSFTWDEFRSLATRLGWEEAIDPAELLAAASEESNALAALVDTIAERTERKEFPVVRPEELAASADTKDADDIVRFCKRVEATQLQSYIDMHWQKYMEGNPGDTALPIRVQRAHWIREHYYNLCRTFLAVESLRTRAFQHGFRAGMFLPLILPASIEDATKQAEAMECVQRMTPASVAGADVHLWKKWEDIAKMLFYFEKPVEDVFFRAFIERA